jgi:hypothetical protein
MEEIGLALPAIHSSRNQCFYPWWKLNYILNSDFENIRTHSQMQPETIQMLAGWLSNGLFH